MKKNVLEKIEQINEEKKLSEDSKKEILVKIFDNLIIAANIVLLFTILIVARLFLNVQNLINIYNTASVAMLAFTIFVFEFAYKKDSGSLAICGIEMLVFSIAILFMPYCLVRLNAIPLKFINIYVITYYIVKVIIMYNRHKSRALLDNSDIKQIIKKESKDSKVEEAINEIKKNKVEGLKNNVETKKKKTGKTIKKEEKQKSETKKKDTNKAETKKTTKSKTASTKKENSQIKTNTKSKKKETKKENGQTKTTTKKASTTKKKTNETDKEKADSPKKRGRPRKETVNQ